MQVTRLLLILAASVLFSACATLESYVPTMADFRPIHGPARVKIDLSEQRAYLYKRGELLTDTRISTGRDGYQTPTGTFRVTQKDRDHRSSIYGDYVDWDGDIVRANVDIRRHRKPRGTRFLGAPMPYFLRFNGAVGMHSGDVPWYPASHGCVRLPPRMARVFFNNVSIGTPVRVVP